MQLIIHEFDLPLKHVFTIARGSTSVQPTFIVELIDTDQHGYGEATTNTYYGATYENMRRALDGVLPIVQATAVDRDDPDWPARLWQAVAPQLAEHPFALCALDLAAHDLWGKCRGQAVHAIWNLKPADAPLSNFTIGIDSIPAMVAKMNEVPDWPIYKIKLGTPDDLAIIRELRSHTSAIFRVDANCGWSVDETIRNARDLQPLRVEFIEQPLPADDWTGARQVYLESALPIIADESCIAEPDVERCHEHFHGVNIKLVKCGGMTPCRRMIARARQLGLKTMVGCMTESTVGISAIAQLAPLLDYVDMDGAALLASDIAEGARLERGKCIYSDLPGNGVELLQS